MSRYYEITIAATPPTQIAAAPATATSPAVIGGTSTGQVQRQWTSFPGGVNDPGALNVEFDFLSSTSPHDGPGFATLTIEGIALPDLFQSQKFYNRGIIIKAGMQAGLPLANPAQAGVIWNGTITQSFGNWVGTDMTLDFVISAFAHYTYQNPGNFVLSWKKGTSLQSALATCLNIAYPTLTPKFNIGSQYVLGYDVLHAVATFQLLNEYVQSITKSIAPPGVSMALRPDGTIFISDGSAPDTPIQVAFNDLIGQPTWIENLTMQFMTVMRADIQVGATIKMPQGISGPGGITTTPQSLPSQTGPQQSTAFQGTFVVQSVRYIGNFRDPNGQSWATIFQCAPVLGAGPLPNAAFNQVSL